MKCKGHRKCQSSAIGSFSWHPVHKQSENVDVPLCSTCLDRIWAEIHRAVERGEIIYYARSIPENLK